MIERLWRRFRLVPMLLIVAGLAFSVRVGDFVHGLDRMGAASAAAPASGVEEVAHAEPPSTRPQAIVQTATSDSTPPESTTPAPSTPPGAATLPDPVPRTAGSGSGEWRDATDTEIESSTVRSDLYQDLARRREQLDRREKEIAVREALLSAAERELDQKLRELKTLSADIEESMQKISEEEEARINSLVKIYETMKPKDAASIFNTLDLDVLMAILTRMSERRASPIIAQMNPDRARTITIMMSEQKQSGDASFPGGY